MIYLGGESSFHNGIMVLPDYGSRSQFYYLPPPPKLVEDPRTGRKLFKLIKFVGGLHDPLDEAGEKRVGVAFFDSDLALGADQLEELKAHVRQTFRPDIGARQDISLSPLLFKSGEVNCFVLGEKDWEGDAPPEGERSNIFVERLRGFGHPSLYGDNRAAFSAQMTPEGARALEASLTAGGALGVQVVYNLKFDALQPAYKFRVKADWERIYSYFEEKYQFDLFFVNFEESRMVEELEEDQLLVFEEILFDSSASGDVQQLRNHVQKYILESFFQPVLAAGEPKYNRVPGLIEDVFRATVLVPSFGYQRRELSQHECRSLSFDATRVSAVERVIHPQANLLAMIPAEEISSYVQEVDGDADLFYRRVQVQCVLGGFDFAKSKINWVHPRIRYGDQPEESVDRVLTSLDERLTFAARVQESHGFRYRGSFEVAFQEPEHDDPDAIYGPDEKLEKSEEVLTDREFAIDPTSLYDIEATEFALKQGFPVDRYPMVVVDALYEDSTGYEVTKSYGLRGADQGAARATFRARVREGETGTLQYRLTYYPASGSEVVKEWQVALNSAVVIDDPFPQVVRVRVAVTDTPEDLAWVDVSVRYEDPAAPGSFREGRLFFDESDLKTGSGRTKEWTVHTSDPKAQRYEYFYTVFYTDGTVLETPGWIESDARTLRVGRRGRQVRTITVRPVGNTFAGEKLRDIRVTLRHRPSEEQRAELVFTSEDDARTYTYRSSDPARMGYAYEILYRWRNGRTKRVEGQSLTGALTLEIPIKGS